MQNKDEFDDPAVFKAVGSIFKAMDRQSVPRQRKPYVAVSIVFALVCVMIGVLWYSYPRETVQREINAVPIVRADAGPYKVIPNDPGGMDIPYRDSTVFATLRGGEDGERRVENLLPDPEEPVDREQLFAGLKTDIDDAVADAESGVDITEPSFEDADRFADKGHKAFGEPKPVEDTAEEIAVEGTATDESVEVANVAAPAPSRKPDDVVARDVAKTEPASGQETFLDDAYNPRSNGGFYVQLASLRSRGEADTAWQGFRKEFISLLGSSGYRVKEANLGERGVYYRLQAGPFDESRARAICSSIQAKKPGGCLVISR